MLTANSSECESLITSNHRNYDKRRSLLRIRCKPALLFIALIIAIAILIYQIRPRNNQSSEHAKTIKIETETKEEELVQNLFGFITKYLPNDLKLISKWQKNLIKSLNIASELTEEADIDNNNNIFRHKMLDEIIINFDETIQSLYSLIKNNDKIRQYVIGMIIEVPKKHRNIHNVAELLYCLNSVIRMAPKYNKQHIGFFPMSSLFVHMMYTKSGELLFRMEEFNDILREILKKWCIYLDSNDSTNVLNESDEGWLCESAIQYNKLNDFIYDPSMLHYGFISFNDYFHREINPLKRPLSGKYNNKIVVSANDGTVYNIQYNLQLFDKFWIKSQPYSLTNILNNNKYSNRFINGTLFQTFLSGSDYHRWRSPIKGIIKHVEIINGLMFSELDSLGFDKTAGTLSEGYEVSVNTRGLLIIESIDNKNIGMVSVIPVGITEISSITIIVKENQMVEKGEELGYFSYGGSSMALIFEQNCIKQFTAEINEKVQVKNQIAETN